MLVGAAFKSRSRNGPPGNGPNHLHLSSRATLRSLQWLCKVIKHPSSPRKDLISSVRNCSSSSILSSASRFPMPSSRIAAKVNLRVVFQSSWEEKNTPTEGWMVWLHSCYGVCSVHRGSVTCRAGCWGRAALGEPSPTQVPQGRKQSAVHTSGFCLFIALSLLNHTQQNLYVWYLSQADLFSSRKTTQLFQRARLKADDTAVSMS